MKHNLSNHIYNHTSFFRRGFTLIELLVVIGIIGILVGLSVFGLQGARAAARDADRKADLENIRSGLEIYKADCNFYPATITFGSSLSGSCPTANTYMSVVPQDSVSPNVYKYSSLSGNTAYELCAHLEQGSGSVSCGGSTNCGGTCNYKVTSP